ncbi:TPA: glycosyltransferase, partial [Enterobacter cloacae]|nr:glycosyltransferase [Enterobacter cloacae]
SGITIALNNGLPYCTGDFIARADGDDIQHPERIARQVDFLNKNEEYGVVGCWVKNIDEHGNETARCEYPIENDDIISCIKYTSPILHIWLARKSVYNKLGGYRKTNPAEDYDFILRCLAYGIKVSNIPFYGSYIRLRSGSTMTESSLKQK